MVALALVGALAAGLLVSSGSGSDQRQKAFAAEVGAVCITADSRLAATGKAGDTSAAGYVRTTMAAGRIELSEARQLAAIRPPAAAATAYRAWVKGVASDARWSQRFATAFAARDSASLAKLSRYSSVVSSRSHQIEQRDAGLAGVCNAKYKIVVTTLTG